MSVFYYFHGDCSLNSPTKSLYKNQHKWGLLQGLVDSGALRIWATGCPYPLCASTGSRGAGRKCPKKRCESELHTLWHACGSRSSSDAPSQPNGGQIRQRLPLVVVLVKEKSCTEVRSNPPSPSFGPFKNTVLFTRPQGVKWGYQPAVLKYLISRTTRALNAKGCLNQCHSLRLP